MMGHLQRGATAVTQIARDTTNGLFAAGGAAEPNGMLTCQEVSRHQSVNSRRGDAQSGQTGLCGF